jgi:ABC-type nitrate/sulfonate/bicarbonate transport system substrate-binding protein
MKQAVVSCSLLVIFCLWVASQSAAEQLKVGVISQSAGNWPLFVAEEKGYFQREGLQVEVVVTGDSGKQIDGLAAGTYHITHQAADHFIRGVEDGKDLVVFMTIARPIFDFVVAPDIRAIKDLGGKTVALDRPTTGYWLLFQKAFAANGLPRDAYKTLPNLGGAEKRFLAVKDGRAQGTFLNPPLSLEAIAQGFPRLTSLAEYFPNFPATSGGARRNWAKTNEATLVHYLRAMISAIDWLLDPKNRSEALQIFKGRVQINEKHLQPSYEAFVGTGLVRAGNLNMEGVQQILELMAESGQLKAPLPAPGKYADPTYQEKAQRDY